MTQPDAVSQPIERGLDLDDLHGRWSLVTGASSGIGREFASQLATRGSDLVLVARNERRLKELADELRREHRVEVDYLAIDLSGPNAAEALVGNLAVGGHEVDILVNSAGFGEHGDLAGADPDRMEQMARLNVDAVVGLSARLLPGMLARRSGAIVNVASTAAFQPVPHMAVYGASKAFVLSFSRALWAETRGTGVQVLALCPGSTDTEFFQTAGEHAAVGTFRTVDQVVNSALRGLQRGRPSIVDGRRNAALAFLSARLPERLSIAAAERSVRPSQ